MSKQNPLAWVSLLVSVIPFLSALALVGLKTGIGPAGLWLPVASASGFAMFGLIVVGTGLSVAALGRAEGQRDWRIYSAFGLQVLSIAGAVLFSMKP